MTTAHSSASSDAARCAAPPRAEPADDYRGLWAMYADSLRGPRAGIVKAALIKGLIFWAFGVFCAVQAILSTDARSAVLWTLGAAWSIGVVVTVKLWWWMEMYRASIVRTLGGGGAAHARESP